MKSCGPSKKAMKEIVSTKMAKPSKSMMKFAKK